MNGTPSLKSFVAFRDGVYFFIANYILLSMVLVIPWLEGYVGASALFLICLYSSGMDTLRSKRSTGRLPARAILPSTLYFLSLFHPIIS